MIERIALRAGLASALFAAALPALAGAQKEEQLSQSVVSGLAKAIADAPVPANYASRPEVSRWISEMSRRIAHKVDTDRERTELLATTHYESLRAGRRLVEVLSGDLLVARHRFRLASAADAIGRGGRRPEQGGWW